MSTVDKAVVVGASEMILSIVLRAALSLALLLGSAVLDRYGAIQLILYVITALVMTSVIWSVVCFDDLLMAKMDVNNPALKDGAHSP